MRTAGTLQRQAPSVSLQYGAHWDDLDETENPEGLGGGSVRVVTVLIYLSGAPCVAAAPRGGPGRIAVTPRVFEAVPRNWMLLRACKLCMHLPAGPSLRLAPLAGCHLPFLPTAWPACLPACRPQMWRRAARRPSPTPDGWTGRGRRRGSSTATAPRMGWRRCRERGMPSCFGTPRWGVGRHERTCLYWLALSCVVFFSS